MEGYVPKYLWAGKEHLSRKLKIVSTNDITDIINTSNVRQVINDFINQSRW